MGVKQRSKVGAFLRLIPTLPADTGRATMRRTKRPTPTETGYTNDEFRQLRARAAHVFGTAHRRIMANAAHLEARQGSVQGPTSTTDLVGEALEHLQAHGDVPTYLNKAGKRIVQARYAAALGSMHAKQTWQRLHLTNVEVVALAILLIAEHGWNASTVSRLRLPERSIGATPQDLIYRVELEKRRRHVQHRYESRNLTAGRPGDPGNLISKAIEATRFSRELLPPGHSMGEHLLLWHAARPLVCSSPSEMIRAGFSDQHLRMFRDATGVHVNLRRLRRTVTVHRRGEAGQQTQRTFDRDYALRDPAFQAAARPVIEAGVEAAIAAAERVVARVARDATVSADLDTVTAACTDHIHSPFTEHGVSCSASFLLCLACPNAVVTGAHLPRLTRLHSALSELRHALPAPAWDAEWRSHHARLNALKAEHFTAAEWSDAATAITPDDARLVDQLLRGVLQ